MTRLEARRGRAAGRGTLEKRGGRRLELEGADGGCIRGVRLEEGS
jgi:hypothetical protein